MQESGKESGQVTENKEVLFKWSYSQALPDFVESECSTQLDDNRKHNHQTGKYSGKIWFLRWFLRRFRHASRWRVSRWRVRRYIYKLENKFNMHLHNQMSGRLLGKTTKRIWNNWGRMRGDFRGCERNYTHLFRRRLLTVPHRFFSQHLLSARTG